MGNVAFTGGTKCIYFSRKFGKGTSIVRLRSGKANNIKMNFTELCFESVDWIKLMLVRFQGQHKHACQFHEKIVHFLASKFHLRNVSICMFRLSSFNKNIPSFNDIMLPILDILSLF